MTKVAIKKMESLAISIMTFELDDSHLHYTLRLKQAPQSPGVIRNSHFILIGLLQIAILLFKIGERIVI